MQLEQSFEVRAPLQQVWEALLDVERVAPCLPGASVTGRNPDGTYNGEFKVKIGPTTAAYSGKLQMENVDEAAHAATLSAAGTDKRGQGGAKATIVSSVSAADSGATKVDVATDYHITGRLARFGRGGMIEEISQRLLGEFATSLQAMLSGGARSARPAVSSAPSAAAGPETPLPAPTAAPAPRSVSSGASGGAGAAGGGAGGAAGGAGAVSAAPSARSSGPSGRSSAPAGRSSGPAGRSSASAGDAAEPTPPTGSIPAPARSTPSTPSTEPTSPAAAPPAENEPLDALALTRAVVVHQAKKRPGRLVGAAVGLVVVAGVLGRGRRRRYR